MKRFTILMIISGLFTACANTETPPEELPITGEIMLDEKLRETAKRIDGFGGMYIDDKGNLNVYLVEDFQRLDAKAAANKQTKIKETLVEIYGKELLIQQEELRAEQEKKVLEIQPRKIIIVKGDYDITQLAKWRAGIERALEVPGVVFTDLDERQNRLKVGIEPNVSHEQIEEIIKKSGIPREAVILEETKPIRFYAGLRSKHRPMPGGVQIEGDIGVFAYSICTMGFNAIRSGVHGFVTNSHCTERRGRVDRNDFHQPNDPWYTEGNKVGVEIADPGYFTESGCPSGRQCRYSDSAYVDYSISRGKNIARTTGWNNGSLTIDSTNTRLTIIGEMSTWIDGSELDKIGRTTGWTYGRVNGTCQNINVTDTNITLFCQYRVNRIPTHTHTMSDNGDSGSPVFRWHGTNVTLSGILWGGPDDGSSFVFSPMNQIEQELGPLTTFNFPTSSSQPSTPVCNSILDCPGGDCVAGPGIGHYECIHGKCVCLKD